MNLDNSRQANRQALLPYVLGMAAASAIGLAKNFLFAALLGPVAFGYYGLVLVVCQVGFYVCTVGIANALVIELPIAHGRGEDERARRLARTGFSAALVLSAVVGTVYIAVVAGFGLGRGGAHIALMLASGTTVAMSASNTVIVILQGRGLLNEIAVTSFTRALMVLAVGAVGALVGGYEGAIVGECLGIAAATLFILARFLPELRLIRPDRRTTVRLIRVGSQLMASYALMTAFFTVDRVVVAAVRPSELGQYTFATLVSLAMLNAWAVLYSIIPSQLLRRYGAGDSIYAIRARLIQILRSLGVASLAGLGCVEVFVEMAPSLGFSSYQEGLNLMPILFIGGALTLFSVYDVLLQAGGRYGLTLVPPLVGAVLLVLGSGLLAASHAPLTAFAWLFVGSRAVMLGALIVATEWTLRSMGDGAAT